MGGKAFLDNHEVCRVTSREYEGLIAKIFDYEDENHRSIPYYSNKESHGDLDVLINSSYYRSYEMKKKLLIDAGLTVIDHKKNGSVDSFLVELSDNRKFQIDMIGTPADEMDFARFYFGFNDLGNLMGRLARATGLKLGHNGLFYTQRSATNDNIILKEHLLSKDRDEVLTHLDLDPNRYREGFKSLEDMFEFVTSSKFYSFDNFDPTQRNRTARTRDAKRPTYTKFLEWAEHVPSNKKPIRWRMLYDYHCKAFPHLLFDMIIEEKKDEIKQIITSRLNGELVMKLTGLEGKELGQFIHHFRYYHDDDWLLKMTPDEIAGKIVQHFNEDNYLTTSE